MNVREKDEKINLYVVLIGLIILLFFTIIIGVSVGTLRIPFEQTYTIFVEKLLDLEPSNVTYSGVLWKIRMPRVLMGVVVGAGLSLCGIVMQAVVQNPLAEPFLLGISAGGYLGATMFIILGSGVLGLVSGLGLAFTAFLGLSSAKWDNLLLPTIAVGTVTAYFLTQYRTLNAMLQGEEIAITLGIRLNFYRKIYTLLVAFLTGILVATCGIIGFVGLVIPHIARALVGPRSSEIDSGGYFNR